MNDGSLKITGAQTGRSVGLESLDLAGWLVAPCPAVTPTENGGNIRENGGNVVPFPAASHHSHTLTQSRSSRDQRQAQPASDEPVHGEARGLIHPRDIDGTARVLHRRRPRRIRSGLRWLQSRMLSPPLHHPPCIVDSPSPFV